MTRIHVVIAGSILLLVASASREVSTQFGTVNRAFHNRTTFRLDGRHQTVACEGCHINGQYQGTPNRCFDCHWVRRRDDRYETRLGSACESCHRPTAWSDVRWNHAAEAGLPLNADHRSLACESCHTAARFEGPPVLCVNCHQKDFAATKSPNHTTAGFSTACDSCHKPGDPSWRPTGSAAFNHNAFFPLVGLHAAQACTTCHKNNVYAGTPRECIGCHLPDYQRAQQPNHVAANFSTACDSCHRPSDLSWKGGGQFNHNAVFALVGLHAQQTCAACHRNGVYAGTPRDCVGCHLQDYNKTQTPNHVAAGFSTGCDSCHRPTDTSWRGANFNHAAVFALVGVHATQACSACHVNGVYAGAPRTCAGCHLPQYNASRNPNHASAGFPTTCDSCHRATDTSWQQGTFAHTRFPLTGPHNVQCSRCHTTANNFTLFSCTVCHTRSETDSHHLNMPGYVYDSNACYSCHPNGRH